jgi:hypothetical protein
METKTEFDKSAIQTQQKLFSSINFSIIFKNKSAGENHQPWANLQSRGRTHAVLVIGLYIQRPNSLSHPGPLCTINV